MGAALLAIAVIAGGAGAAAAGVQETRSAAGFLRALYAGYATGKAPSPTGRGAERLFAPPLLALIRAAEALAGGEVGALDHDPICACQDYQGLRIVTVSVEADQPTHARATVSFINIGQPVTVRFVLTGGDGHCRIVDIEEPGVPSLRKMLADGIAEIAKERAAE